MLFFFQQLYWNERQKRQNCEGFYLKKGLHNAFFSFVIFFYHMIKGKCKKVSLKQDPRFEKLKWAFVLEKHYFSFSNTFQKKKDLPLVLFCHSLPYQIGVKIDVRWIIRCLWEGPFTKYVTHLGGRGVCQKVTLVYKPI